MCVQAIFTAHNSECSAAALPRSVVRPLRSHIPRVFPPSSACVAVIRIGRQLQQQEQATAAQCMCRLCVRPRPYTGCQQSTLHITCELSGQTTEKIKMQRLRLLIPSVSQGGRPVASLFRNLRQSASQNLSKKNVAVLTAPSFLERFCEADWHNSETK